MPDHPMTELERLRHQCNVLEAENTELRRQRAELRAEVKRLSALAKVRTAEQPVTG